MATAPDNSPDAISIHPIIAPAIRRIIRFCILFSVFRALRIPL